MSRPTRWLEEGGASAEVRTLLASAGRSRALPDEARTRSIARLDRYLVWPVAAGVFLWLKGVAIAAGIGVASIVAVTQLRPMLHSAPMGEGVAPSKAHAGATAARTPGGTIAALPATLPPTPATPARAAPPPAAFSPIAPPPAAPVDRDRSSVQLHLAPATSARAQPEGDALTREAAMLERARVSLDRDPGASLVELDAHAAKFPFGTLRIERELLAVDALTRVGSRAEAKRRAEALLEAARGSIYEPRVRSMLDKLQAP